MKPPTIKQIKSQINKIGEDKFMSSLSTDTLLDGLQNHQDQKAIMSDLILIYGTEILSQYDKAELQSYISNDISDTVPAEPITQESQDIEIGPLDLDRILNAIDGDDVLDSLLSHKDIKDIRDNLIQECDLDEILKDLDYDDIAQSICKHSSKGKIISSITEDVTKDDILSNYELSELQDYITENTPGAKKDIQQSYVVELFDKIMTKCNNGMISVMELEDRLLGIVI